MKKIIFFIVYLTVNFVYAVDYDEDSTCCRQYGKVIDTTVGDEVINNILVDAPINSTVIDEYVASHPEYNLERYCKEEGLVAINDLQYDYDDDAEWIDGYREGIIYTRDIDYTCTCDLIATPDLPLNPPEIDTTKWTFSEMLNTCAIAQENRTFHSDVCLESDGVHSLVQSERNDCCTVSTCYVPRSPLCEEPYEIHENYNTLDECQDLATDLSSNNNVQMDYITNPDTNLSSCCISTTPKDDENVTDDGIDTNTTDSDGTDTDNSTDQDSTDSTSNDLDTSEVEKILGDIKSDIEDFTLTNHEDLGEISKELNISNGTLNKIEENTRFLKDLESTFSDSEKSLSDIKDEFLNLSNILNNSQASVSSALSGMLGSLNGFSSPVFQGQGQSLFVTSVFGQTVEFDFSMVEQLRQYFDIVFMLLLVYFNFKMYRWIIEVLLKMGV